MAAAEHGDERLLDHAFLPEDHLADRGLGGGDLRAGRFRLTHDHVVELLNHFSAGYRHLCAPVVAACCSWVFFILVGFWLCSLVEGPGSWLSGLTKNRATFGP